MASNKIKLRNLSKGVKGARRALKLLQRPDILLSSILVGNNFANILASAIVTILMIDYFGGNVLLGSIILTLVILIFSEITPKTIASVYPESFAIKSSWLLKALVIIFKPLVWLTNIVSSRILKLFDVDPIEEPQVKVQLVPESQDRLPIRILSVAPLVAHMSPVPPAP